MSAPSETITISVDLTGFDETSSVSATSIQQESIVSTAVITGPQGYTGPVGPGVPAGGSAGTALFKNSSIDFAAIWRPILAADVSNFDAQVHGSRLDQLTIPQSNINLGNNRITALSDPLSAQDAATKSYVDAIAVGLSIKAAVKYATTTALAANIYLSNVLTASSNGALTVDGQSVLMSDRILIKDESTASHNGIYTVTAIGDGSHPFILTRSTDMDSGTEVPGTFAFVQGGTLNANTGFVVTGIGPFTLGTTSINFTQFSSASGSSSDHTFDVIAYGATGNGTTDDTTSLQAAINAANAAGGGVVFMPTGNYKITSALTIYTGITLRGAGRESSFISQSSTTAKGIIGTDISSVVLEGFLLQGPNSGSGIGIDLGWSSYGNLYSMVFRDLWVRRWGGDGIKLQTPIVSHFDHIVSDSNGGHGFNLWQAGTSCTFTSCWARNNAQAGYRFFESVYMALTGCAADNNGIAYLVDSAQSIGFFSCGSEGSLLNGGSYNGFGWKITNSSVISLYACWITDNRNLGVWITGGSQAISLNIADNSPNGTAVHFVQTDSGTNVTIYELHNTTINSLATGTCNLINDGAGGLTLNRLKILENPGAGYYLISDAAGVAAWAPFDTNALRSTFVDLTSIQTIAGAKTFSSTIAGSISGNAGTVTTNANLNGDVTSSGNTATLANTVNVQSVVRTNRLDQMAAPTAPVAMNGQLLTGLADPVSSQDAVTLAYVNALSMGLFIKIPVRAASTANVTIASPGTTIDGVTLASGDRILLKDQSTARDNGIYIFNGSSSSMTRSTDADSSAEVKAGTYTFVTEGTTNGDTSWVLSTDNPIVLGTTSLAFINFGSSTVPDATTAIKGKIKLAGDLGGTSALPLIKRTKRFIIAPFGDTRPADYTCVGASNNHVEINNAIIAANALTRGATIELLDGYFELGAAVMRLPNVHIYGQGVGHTKIGVVSGGNFTMFDMDKVTYDSSNPLENSIIAEMEISGENMASSSEKKAINGGNFKDCKIFRVWAHDTTATGIGDDDFYGTTIDQCLVTDCGYENKRTITAASWATNIFTFQTSAAHGYSAYIAASGLLTASSIVSDGETVTVDGVIYTFKTTLTGAAFEVLIGVSTATALANLKSAMNLTGTIGTDYGTGTTKHPTTGGGTLTSTTLVLNANTVGTAGNSITTTETGANLSFGAVTLSGGATGNKIVIAGMVPALYNGTFNVTTVPDSTHFTISSATNSGGLNFTINPGTPTVYGSSSDSILGHNGIGIASGALTAEACIVTNCVCIGNQNNNFLIEADNSNGAGNEVFLFSNCVSINAGSCGFRNTGSINAQFNNCYDYGSPIGGQAISTYSSKAITVASWSAGVVTFTTSAAYLFGVGDRITIAGMVPDAYNGYYTVQSIPTSTTFTVNITSNPGTAVHFGTSSFEAHPVDGSAFNNPIFSNNLNIGLYLPDSGVTANNPVIKNSYNYGAQLNSCSNSRLEEVRIYNSGRQGVYIVMGSGVYAPMDHVKITGHIYNSGQRFANCDGIDVDPSLNSAAIQNLEIDVHAFDDQDTKTQRYGVILRSGGTLDKIHVKGNLTGNATAPILVQNTSDTIYTSDILGINPNGKHNLGNVTGSTSFDVSIANIFMATLTGNITAVMATPPIGGVRMTWILTQDGTGSRTLTLPANATSGTTLTLSTTAAAIDVLNWSYDSVGGKWRLISSSLAHVKSVAEGGTGKSTTTAYAVLAGGTTTTGALQQVSGVGSSGQILTSNGASALPTWQATVIPALTVTATSVNYSTSNTNDIVVVTVSGKVITLHDSATATVKPYIIKNLSNGNISFATTSSQTVDGSTTGTIVPNQSLTVIPYSGNWIII